jgi:hypothetical protein
MPLMDTTNALASTTPSRIHGAAAQLLSPSRRTTATAVTTRAAGITNHSGSGGGETGVKTIEQLIAASRTPQHDRSESAMLEAQLQQQIAENELQAAALEQSLQLLTEERASKSVLAAALARAEMLAATAGNGSGLTPAMSVGQQQRASPRRLPLRAAEAFMEAAHDGLLETLAVTRCLLQETELRGRRQLEAVLVIDTETAWRAEVYRRWARTRHELTAWSQAYLASVAVDEYVGRLADTRIHASASEQRMREMQHQHSLQQQQSSMMLLAAEQPQHQQHPSALFEAFLMEELREMTEALEASRRHWLLERERRDWLAHVAMPHRDAMTRASTAVLICALQAQEAAIGELQADVDRLRHHHQRRPVGVATLNEAALQQAEADETPTSPLPKGRPPLAPTPSRSTQSTNSPLQAAAPFEREALTQPQHLQQDASPEASPEALLAVERLPHVVDDDDVMDECELLERINSMHENLPTRTPEPRPLRVDSNESSAASSPQQPSISPSARRHPPADTARFDIARPHSQSASPHSPERMSRRELLALTAALIDQNASLAAALVDLQRHAAVSRSASSTLQTAEVTLVNRFGSTATPPRTELAAEDTSIVAEPLAVTPVRQPAPIVAANTTFERSSLSASWYADEGVAEELPRKDPPPPPTPERLKYSAVRSTSRTREDGHGDDGAPGPIPTAAVAALMCAGSTAASPDDASVAMDLEGETAWVEQPSPARDGALFTPPRSNVQRDIDDGDGESFTDETPRRVLPPDVAAQRFEAAVIDDDGLERRADGGPEFLRAFDSSPEEMAHGYGSVTAVDDDERDPAPRPQMRAPRPW